MIDLTGRQPPWPSPAVALWLGCTEEAAREQDLWALPAPQGDERLRTAIGTRCRLDPAKLTVTSGARAAAITYARTARNLVLERPTFAGVEHVLRSGRGQVTGADWSELCGGGLPSTSTLWVTSPARNPDGATLTDEQCRQLDVQIERGHRVVVNGTYSWWQPHSPRPANADLLGTLSKLGGMGVRLGWVYSDQFFTEAPPELLGGTPSCVWQRMWALFIERGGLSELGAVSVARSVRALHAFATGLAEHGVRPPQDGGPSPHLLLDLAPGRSEDEARSRLAEVGLAVGPGSAFAAGRPSVRVSFLSVDEDQAADAALRVVRAGVIQVAS